MTPREVIEYYSREDVQREMLRLARDKEIAGVFRNGSYSQRPNTLVYPHDVVALARAGNIEFHCSLEYWKNPLFIKEDYNEMRTGFDIILDIDCKSFELGKIATVAFSSAIEKHGIRNYSIKFTGGKGFHIGIPWTAIPKEIDYKPSEKLYPAMPRMIVEYLKNAVKDELSKEILKRCKPEDLAEKNNIKLGDLVTDKGMNPYKLVDIDPILISPRHLFRMPYSLNRNTFLVSLPIKKSDVEDFRKEQAEPHKISVNEKFFGKTEENEAELLIAEAMDWKIHKKNEEPEQKKPARKITGTVSLDLAPPCIKAILNGLADGKKRAAFILLNYLSSTMQERGSIESLVSEWDKKNKPNLKENYIRAQLRYHFHRGKTMLPPNCLAKGYYQDMGVCRPDEICTRKGNEIAIKNPVNYPFLRMGKKKAAKK
jgi:hypothetical protein